MKYALIAGLLLVIFWLWRSSRQAGVDQKKQTAERQKPASIEKVTEMVACQVCHIHLPRHEALNGRRGLYCSVEHQQQAGD